MLFCDATATVCENNSALGLVQLTAPTSSNPNSTATLKLGSGPLGIHSYKAVYQANNLYSTSTSNTVSYTVQGHLRLFDHNRFHRRSSATTPSPAPSQV